jgi:hypothetical protein
VQAMMIEIHDAPKEKQDRLYSHLREAGLVLKAPPLQHGTYALAMFQRC